MEVLASKLEESLPGRARVERRGGGLLGRGPKHVREVRVELGALLPADDRRRARRGLARAPGRRHLDQARAARPGAWVAALTADLRQEAERSAEARAALEGCWAMARRRGTAHGARSRRMQGDTDAEASRRPRSGRGRRRRNGRPRGHGGRATGVAERLNGAASRSRPSGACASWASTAACSPRTSRSRLRALPTSWGCARSRR